MDQKTTYSYQRTPGLDCPICNITGTGYCNCHTF